MSKMSYLPNDPKKSHVDNFGSQRNKMTYQPNYTDNSQLAAEFDDFNTDPPNAFHFGSKGNAKGSKSVRIMSPTSIKRNALIAKYDRIRSPQNHYYHRGNEQYFRSSPTPYDKAFNMGSPVFDDHGYYTHFPTPKYQPRVDKEKPKRNKILYVPMPLYSTNIY